jgi:hypothetical protein
MEARMAGWKTALSGCCLLALASAAAARADTARADLSAYYANLEAALIARGALKADRGRGGAFDAARLERDFMQAALMDEYGSGLSSGPGTRSAKALLRWEEPVRIKVSFGASVPAAQRRADHRRIDAYAARLARVTGHPVALSADRPNLHVLVVSEAERRSLGTQLHKLVPGISPWMVRTIARMQPNHLCMVVAEPHANRRQGYARAVAIVRAEHSDLMRASCIEEELAQAMGLPNDCDEANPSIFNDNQEYALLTRRDEILLKMLYSPRLVSGMTAAEVRPVIHRMTRQVSGS